MIGRYRLKIDKMERRIKESENSFLIEVETASIVNKANELFIRGKRNV